MEVDNSRVCSYILFVPADEAGIAFSARMAELARLRQQHFGGQADSFCSFNI
jgi:hypothetical protein